MSQWRGRLSIGVGRLLYKGPVGATDVHAHHAFQCVRVPTGTIALADGHGTRVDLSAALIPPDVRHAIVAPTTAALLYVERESRDGRALLETTQAGPTARSWRCDALAAIDADAPVDAWLRALRGDMPRPRLLHPGLLRALRPIDDRLDGPLRLAELAAVARVSEGRLSHLFAEEIGLGMRPYVLWRRLARAAQIIATGRATLTEVAHGAGFADAAHMTRTFRRMFGIAPSEIVDSVEWETIDDGAIA